MLKRLSFVAALAAAATAAGQARQDVKPGDLAGHPAIQYAARPTSDRVARLNDALAQGARSLRHEGSAGYLRSVLDSLSVPLESQLLVFSKTGAQRAFTGPHNPRALYFDRSVAVGYAPGAPVIEVAAHDPQQGVVFYTIDQAATTPSFTRQTSCLACHSSASTLDVPGFITRSHIVGDDGMVTMMEDERSHDIDHRTPHPDRWGGWFVTFEGGAPPYSQRAHAGNITFSGRGNTSNQVFVDWLNSAPESRGYFSSSSDIVALLVFDHQMHAINVMTRLNWESRVASSDRADLALNDSLRHLAAELADYLLFVDEARLQAPLVAPPRFAASLESGVPKDRRGRSFAQLDVVNRLLKYPCSFMIYADAFDALPAAVRQAVYRRMLDTLSASGARTTLTPAERQAILEILRETKSDFPR